MNKYVVEITDEALTDMEYIIILQTHYWLRKMLWGSIIELQKQSSH